MTRQTYVTQSPVTLDGYQAIMKPSKFGYSLSCIVCDDIVDQLETERPTYQKWWDSKLKNPKRAVQKPEPWEEVEEGKYKIKFSWPEEKRPPVVDTEGTPLSDPELPVYAGATVKIAFHQQPYVLRDGVTYGSTLKLQAIQVVSLNALAGVDTGSMSPDAAKEIFGNTEGFKASDPNVTPNAAPDEDF